MKCFLTLVLLALAVLMLWTYRSRVRSTFKLLTVAYAIIMGVNIVRALNDDESSGTVVVVLLGFMAVWAAGWVGVTLWNRRRPGKA